MLGIMRLLVVDDDLSVGKLLRAIFEREGWEVDYASSGDECITSVGTMPPDVIVLDHMMPGLTGIETARQLRRDGFDKPIVLFSAYVGPDLQTAVRVAALRVPEGSTARFTLALARPSTLVVSVRWATVGETATSGADFTAGRGVTSFAPGAVSVTVDVPVTADTVAERDETFRLQLSQPVNAWLPAASAEVTVIDGG